jgi:hypothetical protein
MAPRPGRPVYHPRRGRLAQLVERLPYKRLSIGGGLREKARQH